MEILVPWGIPVGESSSSIRISPDPFVCMIFVIANQQNCLLRCQTADKRVLVRSLNFSEMSMLLSAGVTSAVEARACILADPVAWSIVKAPLFFTSCHKSKGKAKNHSNCGIKRIGKETSRGSCDVVATECQICIPDLKEPVPRRSSGRTIAPLERVETKRAIFLATESENSLRISAPQWWPFKNGEMSSIAIAGPGPLATLLLRKILRCKKPLTQHKNFP